MSNINSCFLGLVKPKIETMEDISPTDSYAWSLPLPSSKLGLPTRWYFVFNENVGRLSLQLA